ncbi:LapA family protein [Alkalibacter mobilis]|uniref:LapA family protein n=1 Tax=Alkalibacter mobilis TaxID=2787712 RepID=UPI0018A0CB97|nr:LapA family protein [Alkalibacter mobilis]MBF7095887.1 LapA family protein [Alkalibacter mobilis]
MQAGFILSIIFAILVSIFALQNAQPVDINFFVVHGQASLALVILISVALGAVILGLFNIYNYIKSSKSIKKLQSQVQELEGQLSAAKDALKIMENSNKPDDKSDSLTETVNDNADNLEGSVDIDSEDIQD